eukprot:883176-Rhodomonas_salina.2
MCLPLSPLSPRRSWCHRQGYAPTRIFLALRVLPRVRIDVIGWMGDKFEEWEVTTPTRIKRKQPHSPHALPGLVLKWAVLLCDLPKRTRADMWPLLLCFLSFSLVCNDLCDARWFSFLEGGTMRIGVFPLVLACKSGVPCWSEMPSHISADTRGLKGGMGMDMDKMDGSVAYLQKENFIAALKHEVPSPEPMRRCLGFAHRSLSPPFWSRRLKARCRVSAVVRGVQRGEAPVPEAPQPGLIPLAQRRGARVSASWRIDRHGSRTMLRTDRHESRSCCVESRLTSRAPHPAVYAHRALAHHSPWSKVCGSSCVAHMLRCEDVGCWCDAAFR